MFRSIEWDPITLQHITLHITNCSSCGPEDGLLQTETGRPVNFILDTLEKCVVFDRLQYRLVM